MATQPKRRRVEEPHPSQVKAAELQIVAAEATVEGLTHEENARVARYFEYQFARLLVKMRLSGKYRFVFEAIKE